MYGQLSEFVLINHLSQCPGPNNDVVSCYSFQLWVYHNLHTHVFFIQIIINNSQLYIANALII